jgi:hypothetical protein
MIAVYSELSNKSSHAVHVNVSQTHYCALTILIVLLLPNIRSQIEVMRRIISSIIKGLRVLRDY